MAKLTIKKDSTDVTVYIFLQDSTSTTGAGKTGLAYDTASLVCYYVRQRGTATALSLVTLAAADSAHSDGGFKEVSSANMPGVYRLDLSDAVCATGSPYVAVMLKGATGMAPVLLEIQLTDFDLNDADPDVNVTKIAGSSVSTSSAQLGVNVVNLGGSAVDQASGLINANVVQISGDAAAADNLEAACDGNTYNVGGGAIVAASVTAEVTANVTKISGDATAADNLELQFDGTGLTGDTYPSTQAQVGNIATTGAAAYQAAASFTKTTGGTEVGTFANTDTSNSVYHQIPDSGGALNVYYEYTLRPDEVAVGVQFKGRMTGTNDSVACQAYDWVGDAWVTLFTVVGVSGTTDQTTTSSLVGKYTGTAGAETGLVRIRFFAASGLTSANLFVDQCIVAKASTSRTVGYSDGAVWINTAVSNTNTTSYVDGVADNPVSTYAAAKTIAAALGLKRFRIANGSTLTLDSTAASYSFVGKNWTLALNEQDIDGAYFEGAEVSGTGKCTTQAEFVDCHINVDVALGASRFLRCGFAGSSGSPFTAGSNVTDDEFLLVDCYSEVPGSGTPYFVFNYKCGVNFRRWSGGSNITLNSASATLTMEVVTGGGQTINTGGASVELRGICRAVTLNGIASGATCQINAVTGPITLAGADGTVNIYGVCGVVTDNRTGTPTLSNKAVSQATVNVEVDTALADYDAPTKAELDSAVAPLALQSSVDDLEGRLTATRAGYLDNLSGGAVATAASIAALNNLSAAQVNAEVDTALADIHLDHLLAADYDPASKPGVATALLNELVENDGGVSRFTANALEQAPAGGGGGGGTDWTAAEREQIRYRLQIDGTQTAPADTDLPVVSVDDVTVGGQQDVRDAMKLAPTTGTPATGSVDKHLDDILTDTETTLDDKLDAIKAVTDQLDVSAVTQVAASSAGHLTITAGLTFNEAVTGLTIPADWVTAIWTLKNNEHQADTAARLQLRVSNPADNDPVGGQDGLQRINGAAPSSPVSVTDGTLTVTQASGRIDIYLTDELTTLLEKASGLGWDVKFIDDDGDSVGQRGTADVVLTETRALA